MKRYKICWGMEEEEIYENGDWCKWIDVKKLEIENRQLREYIKNNVKHKKICDKVQYDSDDLAYISNDHKCNCGLNNILRE